MAILSIIRQFTRQSRHAGNSLTLLLVSLALMSLSLSSTVLMLSPQETRLAINTEQREAIEEVADNHLALLEEYILNHPELFMQSYTQCTDTDPGFNRIWDCDWESRPDDTMPVFQRILEAKYNDPAVIPDSGPDNLKTYSETITINGEPFTVESSLFWDDTAEEYSIIRLPETPYGSNLVIEVEAQAVGIGSATIRRRKLVSFSPEVCDLSQAHASSIFTYEVAEEAGETTDFSIKAAKGGLIQVGTQRLCWIPEMDHSGDLSCVLYHADGIDLLHVDRLNNENINAGEQTWTIFVKGLRSNPLLKDELWLFYVWETGSDVQTVTLNSKNLNPDDVFIHHANPLVTDIPNGGQHKAVIMYPNRTNSSLVYRTWQWDTSNIAAASAETAIIAAGSFTPSDSFAYHQKSRRLVIADVTPGTGAGNEDYIRFVTLDPDGAPPIGALSTSDNYSDNINEYGRPVFSADGNFVLVPAIRETGATDYVEILAFSLQDVNIDSDNLISAAGLNYRRLMVFSAANNLALNADPRLGGEITNLNDVFIWFNPDTNKFYWAVRDSNSDNLASEQVVFEWDPNHWGVGGTTGGRNWVNETQTLNQKQNRKVRGDDPGLALVSYTDFGYTGDFWNVRKIPVGTTLWRAATPQLQVVYAKKAREFVFRDNDRIHAVNIITGGTPIVDTRLAPAYRNLAIDPQSGVVFYTSATASEGIYAFNPMDNTFSQIESVNFSDYPNPGEGNLVHYRNTESLYYMDVPAIVNAINRPTLKLYHPFCNKLGRTSVVGYINGFTNIGETDWIDVDEYSYDWTY